MPRKPPVGLAMFLMAIMTGAVTEAHGQNARRIAEKAFPSVLMLVLQDANGQPLAIGSGFFVREDVVASNLHVIRGAASGYARLVREKTNYEITGVVGSDPDHDLVLLAVKGVKGVPLPFGDAKTVGIGDEVYVVGNPLGLEGTFSAGIVSGVRKLEGETIFQITAPISPGSSGGPVMDTQGRVIGIAAATFSDGQNLNFAIPVSYLQQMPSDVKKVTPLPEYASVKKPRAVFAEFGEQNQGVVGAAFQWDSKIQYSFSLRNRLPSPVRNIRCLVIFYDSAGEPLDARQVDSKEVVPAGLAKRVVGYGSDSVFYLLGGFSQNRGRVEIRVLDYQIIE